MVQEAVETILDAWPKLVVAFTGEGTASTKNGLSMHAPTAKLFNINYIQANALPLNLGIWAWVLSIYYLRLLGPEAFRNPLIQSLQHAMQAMLADGK